MRACVGASEREGVVETEGGRERWMRGRGRGRGDGDVMQVRHACALGGYLHTYDISFASPRTRECHHVIPYIHGRCKD